MNYERWDCRAASQLAMTKKDEILKQVQNDIESGFPIKDFGNDGEF
jgi:hypothetical protein